MSANWPVDVTVVLPAFNAETTVAAAAQSILTERDIALKLLVMDDGSTDRTAQRVLELGDPRVELVRSESNRGLVTTLNEAYTRVKSPLLARMDADDVSLPGRLSIQLRFLRDHPEVDVVGAATWTFRSDQASEADTKTLAESDAAIRWAVFFEMPLTHSALVARTERWVSAGPLDPAFVHAEDYEFVCRNLGHLRFANVARILLHVRRHAQSVSARFPEIQRENTLRALRRLLRRETGRDVPRSVAAALRYPWDTRDAAALAQASDLIEELEECALSRLDPNGADAEWIRRDASLRIRANAFFGACASPAEASAFLRRWLCRDGARAPLELGRYAIRRALRRCRPGR